MKNYKLKFSKILNDAKTNSDSNKPLSKYLSNICLNSKDLDLSNKISFLTLITYISIEIEKNPNTILLVNQKLSKYILTENSINMFIFIRSLYRTARILREAYSDYYRSYFYIFKTEQLISKSKINSNAEQTFREEKQTVQRCFKDYIFSKQNFFKKLFYDNSNENQIIIDKLFEIKNIVNSLLYNRKTICKAGYAINAKWLSKMELFLNEYLSFFGICSNYNESDDNGKYKRTAMETKFEKFISRVFDINSIEDGIICEGEDIHDKENDKQNEEMYYPGKIDNFPLVKWKDLFPDKNAQNTENSVILRKDIAINKHYYLIAEDKWNLISSIFDNSIIIKRSHDESSLELYKILFLFPELKTNKNYERWNKIFYLQMSKVQSIKDLLSKLEIFKGTMLGKTCIGTSKLQYNFYSIPKEHKEILNDFIFIYHNSNFKQFICANNSFITKISETENRKNLLKKLNFNPQKEILIIEQYSTTPFISIPSMNTCCFCKKEISSDIVKCDLCSYGQYCSTACLDKDINEKTDHNVLHQEVNKFKSETITTQQLFSISMESILTKNDNKGLCGLENLGNTCYMNSALQCLSHTEELTKYLLLNIHEQETNISNRLGTSGILLRSFYKLICNLWKGNNNSISPYEFKNELGNTIERFSSLSQQDSHEFLSLFLEYLHEDLNRISNKPYIDLEEQKVDETDEEASQRWWSSHKQREDSIISDLFHGQLKSRIDCPDCNKISITYDPFMFLALPLGEREQETTFTFKYFYFDEKYELLKCNNYTMSLTHNTVVSDMIKTIEVNNMVGSDNGYEAVLFKNDDKIFKGVLPMHHTIYQYLSNQFEICIYNKENPKYNNTYVYPAMKTSKFLRFLNEEIEILSYPFAIAFNDSSYLSDIQKECFKRMKHCIRKEQNDINANMIKLLNRHSKIYYVSQDDTLKNTLSYTCPFCNKSINFTKKDNEEKERYCELYSHKKKDQTISTTSNGKLFNEIIILCAVSKYKDYTKLYDGLNGKFKDHMKDKLIISEENKKNSNKNCNIYDMLDSYLTKEKLKQGNEWYCNKCKQHKEAFKKIDIYHAPNFLIVQFKRFKIYDKGNSKKMEMFVDFPKDNLDLAKYVIGEDKDECFYDLYGIVNHYGTIDGGHYIAFCKNNNKWYEFNDSKVAAKNAKDIVTNNAYLLFYKKRNVKTKNN